MVLQRNRLKGVETDVPIVKGTAFITGVGEQAVLDKIAEELKK